MWDRWEMERKDKRLVIIGAGEFGQIAYEYFTYDSEYEVVAFAVEREYRKNDVLYGLPMQTVIKQIQLYGFGKYEKYIAYVIKKVIPRYPGEYVQRSLECI